MKVQKNFFERVREAWCWLSGQICDINENALLITHSGVMNIILHQVNATVYTNKAKQISIRHAGLIALKHEQGNGELARRKTINIKTNSLLYVNVSCHYSKRCIRKAKYVFDKACNRERQASLAF